MFGWPAVGGHGGEGPAVVSRWWRECDAGGGWVLIWILGRRVTEKGVSGCLYGCWKMGERGGGGVEM
jgi:hypothetical protein